MQSKNITRLAYIVNRFFIIPAIIILFLSSCGFQLNRNKVILPNNGKTLSLDQIENESFNAMLHILLKDMLSAELMRNSIPLTEPNEADLSLQFNIKGAALDRGEITITEAGASQTAAYEYTFTVNGVLNITDNRDKTLIFENIKLSCLYSRESNEANLSQTLIDDGYLACLDQLSKKILIKFTQHF